MMVFAVVVLNTDMTGNLDLQSIKTRMFLPVWNGSLRSRVIVSQELSGISLMSNGSHLEVGVAVTWQARKLAIKLSIFWVIPGHQTFFKAFVLMIPWCCV